MSPGISGSKSPRRHWTAGSPQQRRQYGVKDLVRKRNTESPCWLLGRPSSTSAWGGGQQQTGSKGGSLQVGQTPPPPPKYCARTAREPEWQQSSPQGPAHLSPSRRGGGCCQSQDPHQNISPLLPPQKNQLQSSNGDPAAGGVLRTCGWWGSGAARPLPESSRREPRSGRRTQTAPKPGGREVNAGGGVRRRGGAQGWTWQEGGEVAAPLGHAGNEGTTLFFLDYVPVSFQKAMRRLPFAKNLKKIWAGL